MVWHRTTIGSTLLRPSHIVCGAAGDECPCVSVKLEHGPIAHQGLCSNGTYLFVRTESDTPEVLKLGTGLNGTTLGRVYNSVLCSKFGAECATRPWIGALGCNFLLLQGAKNHTVLVLSADDLCFHSTVHVSPSEGCTESAFYTTSGMELHCVELRSDDGADDVVAESDHAFDTQSTASTEHAEVSDISTDSMLKLLDRTVRYLSTFESTELVETPPENTSVAQQEYSAVSRAMWSLPACVPEQDVTSRNDLLCTLPTALASPREILELLQTEVFTVLLTQEGRVWVRSRSFSEQLRDHALDGRVQDNGPPKFEMHATSTYVSWGES